MADFRTEVDRSGRILIPLELRREINVNTGDTLVLRKIDNEIKLLKYQDVIREIQSFFASRKKEGISMTDEIIRIRREENKVE
ncbi:AbrB/MazE/SpoVT family DNA-binding domain-containing protein [Candidatus Jidaibacter acanthamoebae]|nr:AbrB/MazE/SpoVT family DNA-binding domain-containing protein [Candidatus Jidaibacter acanthamoeba]